MQSTHKGTARTNKDCSIIVKELLVTRMGRVKNAQAPIGREVQGVSKGLPGLLRHCEFIPRARASDSTLNVHGAPGVYVVKLRGSPAHCGPGSFKVVGVP